MPSEKNKGQYSIVKVLDKRMIVVLDPSHAKGTAVTDSTLGVKEKQYSYDHVFEDFIDTVTSINLRKLYLINLLSSSSNKFVMALTEQYLHMGLQELVRHILWLDE